MAPAREADTYPWIHRYFTLCADKEIDAAMEYWAPEGTLQFANHPRVDGRETIRANFKQFVGNWQSETHTVRGVWELDHEHLLIEMRTRFRTHDGNEVTVEGVTFCRFNGERFLEQRTYVDLSPVLAGAAAAG